MKEGENKKTPRMHRFAGIITATPYPESGGGMLEAFNFMFCRSNLAFKSRNIGRIIRLFFCTHEQKFEFCNFYMQNIDSFSRLFVHRSKPHCYARVEIFLVIQEPDRIDSAKKIVTLSQLILMERLAQSRLHCLALRHQRHRLREVHLHQMLVFHPV